jgi:hypothetical protein
MARRMLWVLLSRHAFCSIQGHATECEVLQAMLSTHGLLSMVMVMVAGVLGYTFYTIQHIKIFISSFLSSRKTPSHSSSPATPHQPSSAASQQACTSNPPYPHTIPA